MTRRVGRPRVSHSDERSLEYLIGVSNKHDIDPNETLDALLEAEREGESRRNDFKIQCRHRGEGNVFFLLTLRGKMTAQLRFNEALLTDQSKTRAIFRRLNTSNRSRRRKNRTAINPKISDLKVGAKVAELKAKVVNKQPTRRVQSRWGNSFLFSMATISDGTAVINLPLWNAQTGMISIGDIVKIENGRVGFFQGERQLNVSRKIGKLSVL